MRLRSPIRTRTRHPKAPGAFWNPPINRDRDVLEALFTEAQIEELRRR